MWTAKAACLLCVPLLAVAFRDDDDDDDNDDNDDNNNMFLGSLELLYISFEIS